MADIEVVFTGVAVADFEPAVAWYRRLFGRPEDIVVNDDEVMWRITDTAWLYVVGDEQRAGHALVALSVPDLSLAVEEIENRGLECGPVEIVGDGARKALIIDPEGNTVALIEV
jgi:predicted enzyme related to lactoylglutathione lyase